MNKNKCQLRQKNIMKKNVCRKAKNLSETNCMLSGIFFSFLLINIIIKDKIYIVVRGTF